MKKFLLMVCITLLGVSTSCTEDEDINDPSAPVQGFATGRVVDTQGNPIAGADIVLNNTQFYNHNILGQTDAEGFYQLELTPGSWYVRATIEVPYDNRTYILDLHPETDGAFAGTEGAVRNFHWKLSGPKPTEFGGGGFYGGSVEIMGSLNFFDVEGVALTLEPVAALIDGSIGQTVQLNPEGNILEDVPLGKYKISARYVPENRPMKIRIRNKNQAFSDTVTDSFEPAYAGATGSYKITVEVE